MAATQEALHKIARYLPGNLRSMARTMYYRGRNPAHPAMKGFGTVQDLYYWVADGDLDTVLLLQNYFSALYPAASTETRGTVTFYDKSGVSLGEETFSLPHLGSAKFRLSSSLERQQSPQDNTFGTLEVNIDIPKDVLDRLRSQRSMYFWDRFYIGYTNRHGQVCFVHGVDKTYIYRAGKAGPSFWYKTPENRQWAPEIPVDILDYKKFSVIMLNRTSRSADVTLTLTDIEEISRSWSAEIPSKGAHRFELTPEDVAGLVPTEMRMRVQGMASRYGRPVVFKEFANGAISAMHC